MSFVEVNGVVTHYRVDGDAGTTVGFVNSLGSDLRIWDEVVPALRRLAGGRRETLFFRYDFRGHGLTESTPPPYSLESLAEDLALLLDACGTTEAVLCGVSIGALIAMQLALADPKRVKALILCGAEARMGEPTYWQSRIGAVQSGGIEAIAAGALERWFTPAFRAARPADVRGWRNMLVRTSTDGYLGASMALRDGDLRHEAGSLHTPSLVIAGSEDPVTPVENARELAQTLPRARFEVLAGAGHLPCIDHPKELAETIHSFLSTEGADER